MIDGFAITRQGKAHQAYSIECQDCSAVRHIESHGKKFSIAIIADGVGSCALSGTGARIVVYAAMQQLEDYIKTEGRLDEPAALLNIQKSFERALNSVNDYANKVGQDPNLFSTTLTAAIYDGRQLFYGHNGDGGIVGISGKGEISVITTQHREALNRIYPMQTGKDHWDFGGAKDIAAFALMTDGVLDVHVRPEDYVSNIYVPFFNKCFFEANPEKKLKELLSSPEFTNAVTDDITLVCVANRAVRNIKPPAFDEESWRLEVEKVQTKVVTAEVLKSFHRR